MRQVRSTSPLVSFGRGCDNIGLVSVYSLEALAPDDFSIKVGMELAGKSIYVNVELGEGVGDIF